MSIRLPQNPGIGGLEELTPAEEVFLTSLAGLPYVDGDVLYASSGLLTNLGIGSDAQVLTVSSGLPAWTTLVTGMTIGDAITSGTANSVLFEDASNQLAEDNTDLKYNDVTKQFETRNVLIKGTYLHHDDDLVDMGADQTSNILGYESDNFSDKRILHSTFGENSNIIDGGVRYVPASLSPSGTGEFQIYDSSNGGWRTALTGINIVLDPAEPDIEFTNFSDDPISLITGNGDLLDVDGIPFIIGMKSDMGAHSVPHKINGRIF